MYTFENLWRSVFDGTAKFFPLPWIDANESPNLLNIKHQGRSIIGVFDEISVMIMDTVDAGRKCILEC